MALKAIKKWTPYRDWAQLDLTLTVEQVCAVLRISKPTCLKILQSGELPGTKVCGSWRISKDVLREYLQETTDRQKESTVRKIV